MAGRNVCEESPGGKNQPASHPRFFCMGSLDTQGSTDIDGWDE